jgi:hypothetical protein
MEGSCEHGDEHSGSIKGKVFFEKISNYKLLKLDSVDCVAPRCDVINSIFVCYKSISLMNLCVELCAMPRYEKQAHRFAGILLSA